MAGTLTIHYGLMGSGKTLFAMADVVLPAVKAGRPFFTNITGINLSAISWITGVHPTMIRYYPVKDIHDVIAYFDDNKVSHDGVFILDEMKDFIEDDKATSWLESRINITRKMGVDFLFIAQQNKKQYIHPDLVGLCDTCNYFATRKQKGDTSYVDEYYIQGGDPKVVNKVPLIYDGIVRRKKDERVFLTYSTSDSKYYKGEENDTYKGLMWYQTLKWRGRFVMIFCVLLAILLGLYGVSRLIGFRGKVDNVEEQAKPKKVGQDVQQIKKESSIMGKGVDVGVDGTAPTCYNWKICNGKVCKTDIGIFPNAYDIDGPICLGNKCYSMCQAGDVFSVRGGLLHLGEQVPKGTQPRLRDK